MTHPAASRKSFGDRVKESLGYLKWFYWPPSRMSAKGVYELVATNSFSADGLYLNLGYWKTAKDIDTACRDMARLLAEEVSLKPDDHLLDVGCGFGDQDMLFHQEYGVEKITGLNITPVQVNLGNERLVEAGLDDKITLIEGSATDMPFDGPQFDAVVGLECAFHFDTRETFFKEALRVLNPGGRIALVDMTPAKRAGSRWAQYMQKSGWEFFSKKYGICPENADTIEAYAAKLEASGFKDVKAVSIREHVFSGLHHYMKTNPEMLARFHPLARFPYKMTLFFDAAKVYQAYDYVLISGVKPDA